MDNLILYQSVLLAVWFVALVVLNEVMRVSKWACIITYVVLPIILTFTVWIYTGTTEGNNNANWFAWAKLYSIIALALVFTYMRYSKKDIGKFWPRLLVFLLVLNIFEAAMRDFTLGLTAEGGLWNWMNGTAGILCILGISGWNAIYVEKEDKSDVLWPDLTIGWVIAYDIWNFTFYLTAVPTNAAFGFFVILAPTVAAIWIKRGSWLQARSYTLALRMMALFTFTSFFNNPENHLHISTAPAVLNTLAGLALAANAIYLCYHISVMRRKGVTNPAEQVHG